MRAPPQALLQLRRPGDCQPCSLTSDPRREPSSQAGMALGRATCLDPAAGEGLAHCSELASEERGLLAERGRRGSWKPLPSSLDCTP